MSSQIQRCSLGDDYKQKSRNIPVHLPVTSQSAQNSLQKDAKNNSKLNCLNSVGNFDVYSEASDVYDLPKEIEINKTYNDGFRSISSCSIKVIRRVEKEKDFENHRKEYAEIEKETSQFRDVKMNKLKLSTILNDPMVMKIRQDMAKERDSTYQENDIDNIYQLSNNVNLEKEKSMIFKKRQFSIQQQISNIKNRGTNSFIKVKDILKMAKSPCINFNQRSKSEENIVRPITIKCSGSKHLKF